jgi:predicted TIM-barrel fold metal-dependent hydrolase
MIYGFSMTPTALATPEFLETIKVVDADTHIAEPPDLWTSRMSKKKWGDLIPHLVYDERLGFDRWMVGDRKLTGVANWAVAGWPEHPPSFPRTIEEADQGSFYAKERLERMDEYGVWAAALYPNLLAFSNHAFMRLGDPQLMLETVQAYNDFLTDFATEAPERFILLSALPFWDVEASVKEIHRCADKGHHGILFIGKPHKIGMPPIGDDHWAPIFAACQELKWSVNYHTGFADFTEEEFVAMLSRNKERSDYAKLSALGMLNNGESICDTIMSGVCHKFPDVNFVSVESGFGWLPSFVECMDWQWLNSGARDAYPEREMPSFYFRRQVYGMFWFEKEAVRRIMDLYPDNLMFETDFPHPTSLSPGPASTSKNPKDMVKDVFEGVPADLARKILHENGARLYHLDGK